MCLLFFEIYKRGFLACKGHFETRCPLWSTTMLSVFLPDKPAPRGHTISTTIVIRLVTFCVEHWEPSLGNQLIYHWLLPKNKLNIRLSPFFIAHYWCVVLDLRTIILYWTWDCSSANLFIFTDYRIVRLCINVSL